MMENEPGRKEPYAVVLSAGYSSRMKKFKPLLPIGGVTAIELLTSQIRAAGITDIIVVTGYGRELMLPVLNRNGLAEVYNDDFAGGMFSSIKAGIHKGREMFPAARGCFLMPVDCPLISRDVIIKMKKEIADGAAGSKEEIDAESSDPKEESNAEVSGNDDFYVPVFEGKKGHPIFIPAMYFDEICSYDGGGGLKAVTDRYWDKMVRVDVDDEGCLLDMDTPEGYEEILAFFESGGQRMEITELAQGRRIFLIRHGQTQQHSQKMMIGQYDVQLDNLGRQQASEAAAALALYELDTDVIYASDLKRTAETAEIIRKKLSGKDDTLKGDRADIHVEFVKGFREIRLGKWDGLPISEIRERYPEEYERRGRDIFTFKMGNGFENFYDLQYRAVKALRKILETDVRRDIVIVSHSGVIRALENNLRGLRVDDTWESIPKGGFRLIKM